MAWSRKSIEARALLFQRFVTQDQEDPESDYWMRLASAVVKQLVTLIGVDQYRAWCDEIWPPGTFNTWKNLHDRVTEHLGVILNDPSRPSESDRAYGPSHARGTLSNKPMIDSDGRE